MSGNWLSGTVSFEENSKRIQTAETFIIELLKETGKPLGMSKILLLTFGCECGHVFPHPKRGKLTPDYLRRACWSMVVKGTAEFNPSWELSLIPKT